MSQGLAEAQIELFEEQGYLIVEGVLTEADIRPVRAEYEAILNRVVPQLVAAGEAGAGLWGVGV